MDMIDPWNFQDIKDYRKLMDEFGIKPFQSLIKDIPDPPLFMRRNIIFGHRDFERILRCIKEREGFCVMTGLMPSGKFHLGHAMLVQELIYYQKLGAKIYLCAADLEAYNVRRIPLEKLRKIAVEEYLLNYIALGLNPENCDFYFQSQRSKDFKKSNAYYRLIGLSARRVTFNEMEAIYGEITPGKMVSVLTQISDILHPQLPEFEGLKPVLVPVGIDQDPHIRLTRDIASRFSRSGEFQFILPSSTYHRFVPGLKGGKMSSSDPNSYITLTDSPESIREKIIKHAFSGGRGSIKEHREKGGIPEIDVCYNLLYMMFEPSDKRIREIYEEYKNGSLLTGELKEMTIEKISEFIEKHREKLESAKERLSEFLD